MKNPVVKRARAEHHGPARGSGQNCVVYGLLAAGVIAMRSFTPHLVFALLVTASTTWPAHAQEAGVNQGGSPAVHQPPDPGSMPNHAVSGDAARIEQMRQAERQRRINADSARLATLSAELKAELDHTPADQLSLDMLRKLAEIEKVTRDLKQWLKG